MNILLIGYKLMWHHSMSMKSYLESVGHSVDHLDASTFNKPMTGFNIDKKYDLVLCGQTDGRILFIKDNPNTNICLFCGESYWNPGAMNPDYMICCIPEILSRFKKHHPEIFTTLRKYKEGHFWITPELFRQNTPKTLKGIHFKGVIKTIIENESDFNGGGHFRLYRDAYEERRKFIEDNKYITYDGLDYDSTNQYKYINYIESCEASIIANAYMSYFSKRPIENAAAGCINVFYIRDDYEEKWTQWHGFYDMINCIFVRTKEDCAKFYKLSESQKESMRMNALQLVKGKYDVKIVWKEYLEWIMKN